MKTNTSTWLSDVKIPPAYPTLLGDLRTEVVIIGGGLTGTLTAYLLAKAGKKVVLLEKKDIGNSTTAYTTAWLNCVIDTDLSELIKMYTPEGTSLIWHSGMEAIDLIEKISEEENIECDFSRVSHFRYATSEKEAENLKKDYECAKKLGFTAILHDKQTLDFPNFGSLEIKNQAKFHPIKFLIGLLKASEKYGVARYENTEATEMKDVKEVSGENIVVTTDKGTVEASYSIVATYHPFNNPKELFAHTATYTSYVFEVEIPKGKIKEALYEDEKNPYHYFRIDAFPENDRMIIGGEDHRKEIPILKEKNFTALESYLAELLPGVEYSITRRWSGGIIETIDGLPYIGSYSKTNPNMLLATGFSGNGMTYSAVASRIFTDIILKKQNPYQKLYDAGRRTKLSNFFRKVIDFVGEFFGGAAKNIFRASN